MLGGNDIRSGNSVGTCRIIRLRTRGFQNIDDYVVIFLVGKADEDFGNFTINHSKGYGLINKLFKVGKFHGLDGFKVGAQP